MPRARLCALSALLISLSLAGRQAGAANFDVESLAFVPLRYYPGDEVIVRATLAPEKGERLAELDLKPGSGLPALGEGADPELRALKLRKTGEGWLVELRFVPWSPGTGMLPETRLEGFRIPALPYAAVSLLGPEDRDPSPPRPQRELPGMALMLYGLAAALGVLVILALVVSAYLIPAARALIARRKAALAFKRFDKSIDYLVKEAGIADPAAFFAALVRALRLYLAARVLPEAPALTSVELAALPEEAFPAPATKNRAAALVALADRCRFGGETAGVRALLASAAEEARAIGAANEEVLLARV
jgi:hypothetical protein